MSKRRGETKEETNTRQREYRRRPAIRAKWNEKQRLGRYNMTAEEYRERVTKQGGVCAVCKQPEPVLAKPLSIDHDHATGNIRGLLCTRCNTALGLFQDDTDRLAAAILYLLGGNG